MINFFIKAVYKDNFFLFIKFITYSILFSIPLFIAIEGYPSPIALIGFVFLYPIYLFCLLITRTFFYKTHPAFKRLEKTGKPFTLIGNINYELLYSVLYNGKKVKITPNWIFLNGLNGFHVISTEEIVWVYTSNEHTDVYGDPFHIFKGREYDNFYISLHLKDKTTIYTANHLKKDLDLILERLYTVAPHALYGYSPLLKSIWDDSSVTICDMVNKNKDLINNGHNPLFTIQSIESAYERIQSKGNAKSI
ncbi:hypothetical protein [Clostridium sp. HMP27]|uniref:hypothetical protein n=1 Tax=Clostridium sp. HMP27 TaxID=1487921 RepID=UPI00052CAC45|nr:hypothetical protein [Clostridium sp. HMP27]KGK88589.1 hypothetical protein DP68_06985 [Clostridium sp. HMP27]